MKSNRFIFILIMSALAAGTSTFFVTKFRVCGQCNQGCQTKTFRTEALRLADILESETFSRDQIIDQAQKVFSIRKGNILAAANEALKTGKGRQAILNLIPCPMDANQLKTRSEAGLCCVGPGCCCKFDSVQSEKLAKSDPNFLTASAKLESEISIARQALVSMLKDKSIADDKIIAAVQDCLEKNNVFEIRSIEYFISITPHLTVEQRKQIFCWCAQQIRGKVQVK